MQNPDIHMYLLLSSTATIKLTVKEFRERNKMPQSCFCVPVSPLYLGGNILSRRWRLFCCVHVSPFYILGEHPVKEVEDGLAKQSGDLGGSLFPVIIGRGPRHISLISLHCNEVQRLFFYTHWPCMYTEMHSVWRAKARHNADFIVLLFILFSNFKIRESGRRWRGRCRVNIFLLGLVLTLFRILKSKGLAAGEEEDAG